MIPDDERFNIQPKLTLEIAEFNDGLPDTTIPHGFLFEISSKEQGTVASGSADDFDTCAKMALKALNDIRENLSPFVSKYCKGELCAPCSRESIASVQATHKVEEELFDDDPNPIRHPLTQYVCCKHFRLIMGADACS